MISPAVQEFFPHESVRKSQAALINDIEKTFQEQKILLAQAPTGLGKTASALTVALQVALEKKKRIFFLTNRHTQHHIAIETLKLIRQKKGVNFSCIDLIGKRWMCNQSISGLFGSDFHEFCKTIVERGECEFFNNVRKKQEVQVEAKVFLNELVKEGPLHNEQLIQRAQERRMCGYEIALEVAKNADVIIGDYYYLFNPHIQSTLFQKLNLTLEDTIIIVDEGHNLPSRVRDMVSNKLSTVMMKNALLEARKFDYLGLIKWLQQLLDILHDLAQFPQNEQEKLVRREQFVNKVQQTMDYDHLIEQLTTAADEVRKKQRKSALGGIASFLEAWVGKNSGYTRIITEKQSKHGPIITLSYLCLDPSILTKPVFDAVHTGVIMSGTLQPTMMYRDLLGIEKSVERTYPSPFPPENKLALIVPETTTKFTTRSQNMYQSIAKHVQTIAENIPGNTAVFFPSYSLRDTITEFLQTSKELFWEKQEMSKEEKEQLLELFKAADNGLLLGVTGANFAEGIDFPGDLLKGVIVVGLPLARPDLLTKEVINYYQQKFGKGWDYGYTFPAMSKCIQSAGRCIRSGTDKGVIIYLEERFAWQRYYSCLPREGLIVTKDYQKHLQAFFK